MCDVRLAAEEKERDSVGHDYLFVNSFHNPLSGALVSMHAKLQGRRLQDMKQVASASRSLTFADGCPE